MYINKLISKSFLAALIIIGAVTMSFGQETLKEKISKIGLEVEKVTITAGGEEFTFEGKDAEKLFKSIRSQLSPKSFSFNINEDIIEGNKKIIIKSLNDKDKNGDSIRIKDSHCIWFHDDSGSVTKKIVISSGDDEEVFEFNVGHNGDLCWSDIDEKGSGKKIMIDIKDGVKKVTVTTRENGEEKKEVYEGEEADEYLEELKGENGNEMLIDIDKDCDHHKLKKIFIQKEVNKDDPDK